MQAPHNTLSNSNEAPKYPSHTHNPQAPGNTSSNSNETIKITFSLVMRPNIPLGEYDEDEDDSEGVQLTFVPASD